MTSTLKTEKIQFRGDNSDVILLGSEKMGIGPNPVLHQRLNIQSSAEAGIQLQNNTSGTANSTDGGRVSYYEDDLYLTNYEAAGKQLFYVGNNGSTKAMEIDAQGHVTKPNQPSFVVSYNNNSYNWGGSANGSLVKMAFNSTGTNGHNTGSLWNTSNTRMEAPVAGRYHVGVQWFNNYTSDYARIGAHISINGSTKYQSYVAQWETTGGNNCAAIVNLSANDYVEFWGSIHDNNATGNTWTGYGGAIETYGYGYLIG